MKVSEKTIIDKIYEGVNDNHWSIHNGLGMGDYYRADSTNRSMVAPLIEYLKRKGVEIGK